MKFIAVIMWVLFVTGCSATDSHTPTDITKPQAPANPNKTQSQGPTDWDSLGQLLGCVFAPGSCEDQPNLNQR